MALGEAGVLRRARGVEKQVARHPPKRQHEDDPEHLYQRRLVDKLRHVLLRRRRLPVLSPNLWAEHLVVRARAGVTVVLGVGDAPRVVRYEEGRVADQPHEVVDGLRLGKRLVAALVGEDPYPGHLRALHEPVQRPQQPSRPAREGSIADESRQVAECGHHDEVAGEVGGRDGQVSLEAVSGDRLLKVGELEGWSFQRQRLRRRVSVGDALFFFVFSAGGVDDG